MPPGLPGPEKAPPYPVMPSGDTNPNAPTGAHSEILIMSLAHMSRLQAPQQIPEIWALGQKVLDLGDREPEEDYRLDDFRGVANALSQGCEWMVKDRRDPDVVTQWRLLTLGRAAERLQHRPPGEPFDVYTAQWAVASWCGLAYKAKNHSEAAQAIKQALPWLEMALDREVRFHRYDVERTRRMIALLVERIR